MVVTTVVVQEKGCNIYKADYESDRELRAKRKVDGLRSFSGQYTGDGTSLLRRGCCRGFSVVLGAGISL
jgi:hypothetical protein